jgi:hypothetical protein
MLSFEKCHVKVGREREREKEKLTTIIFAWGDFGLNKKSRREMRDHPKT